MVSWCEWGTAGQDSPVLKCKGQTEASRDQDQIPYVVVDVIHTICVFFKERVKLY